MERSYSIDTIRRKSQLLFSRPWRYFKLLQLFLLKTRIIKLPPIEALDINPLALKGFISVQWNRLPGIGLLKSKALSQSLSDIEEIIDIKVMERTSRLESSRSQLEAFSYSISHDLKSPLRVIHGYCALMKKSPESMTGDTPELLEGIIDSAKKMNRLIDDLLAFSRAECDSVAKEHVDMQEMVKAVLSDTLSMATRKPNIQINYLPDAICDPVLIRQVWTNLISNAIKYSSHNPTASIIIGTQLLKGMPVYYVSDNGAGFDMKFAPKLFRPFSRLHSEEEFEGTGIGLALSHRIIAKHGGRIWADAKSGKGATFYFTL